MQPVLTTQGQQVPSSPGSILIVFGTRPEVIKMAPIINKLRRQRDRVKTIVCTTGQHRELLESMLQTFDLVPNIDLDLMRPEQTLAGLSSAALTAIDAILESIRPDAVLIQGDTTTAMSTALAAFYRRIPVGHVEAGLRTGNIDRPFPEEMNRRVIGYLATWHFARRTAPYLLGPRLAQRESRRTTRVVERYPWRNESSRPPSASNGVLTIVLS